MKRTNFINKKISEQSGITLIALVITIIVLLILAGVTIATLTGDNGLLTKAGEAKNATEIAEEKDIISISAIQAQSENKYGNLEESKFSEALNTNSKTENKASIIAEDIGNFTVKFESNRYYEVNKNGNISYIENATGEKTLTIQCVNSKNEILGEYEYIIVTDQYSKLPPAIDKYESSEEKIEGEITGDKTIQAMYYLICNDDTKLVFTGLDSNGNITTNESAIVSYMVGDNSNISGNGLVSQLTVLSLLKIPETHNGKPVIKISSYAFYNCKNLIEVDIGNNLKTIGMRAFWMCSGIKKLIIGSGLTSIEAQAFFDCSNLKTVIYNNITDAIKQIYGCKNWTELQINPDNENYKVIDNILYSKDGTTLEKAPSGFVGKITILESVSKIKTNAFYYCENLTEVDIGDNLTTIEWRAFWCSGIKKITIGSGLTSIGIQTFINCSNLKTVIIDSSTIATNLTAQDSYGNLVNYATTVYTKVTPGSYITSNFHVETSDIEGYTKYVKN